MGSMGSDRVGWGFPHVPRLGHGADRCLQVRPPADRKGAFVMEPTSSHREFAPGIRHGLVIPRDFITIVQSIAGCMLSQMPESLPYLPTGHTPHLGAATIPAFPNAHDEVHMTCRVAFLPVQLQSNTDNMKGK